MTALKRRNFGQQKAEAEPWLGRLPVPSKIQYPSFYTKCNFVMLHNSANSWLPGDLIKTSNYLIKVQLTIFLSDFFVLESCQI